MATFRENMIARRDRIGVILEAISDQQPTEWKLGLYKELEEIEKRLAGTLEDETATSDAGGPFEEITRGIT